MLSSATNALRALEYLVNHGEAGVSELGRALGVTPGTAHRLVSTLVAEGFAEQNGNNRKYRPGTKVLRLGEQVRGRQDVREIAHDYLVRLADSMRETVNLGVLRDHKIVYIDKVLSDQPFGIEAKVGSRVPAFCTAMGRAILASIDERSLERYMVAMEQGAAGDETHQAPTRAALLRELTAVKRHGFADDKGDYLPDVFCVAAPITDAELQPIAALSLSVPRSRFRANRKALGEAAQSTARELSAYLRTAGITGGLG